MIMIKTTTALGLNDDYKNKLGAFARNVYPITP